MSIKVIRFAWKKQGYPQRLLDRLAEELNLKLSIIYDGTHVSWFRFTQKFVLLVKGNKKELEMFETCVSKL